MRTHFRSRLLGALLSALLLPAFALAQGVPTVDSDGDGVNDAVDAEPCNADVSARVYVPADRTWGMMLFEDQWPNRGDFDFNDAVLGYNQVLRYDSSGRLTGLRMELSVMAVGAQAINGLALRLPNTPRESVTVLEAQVGGMNNPGGAVKLDESSPEAIVLLSESLHALFGVAATREFVNTDPSLPQRPYVDIVVELGLQPGTQLSAADAPFDLFLFDRYRGTEVHRPRYRGTAAMNAALYNTGVDGTSSTRAFVTTGGIPYALELPELSNWAREEHPVDGLYPGIVAFGASAGAQSQDFYRHGTPGSAFGLTPPRSLTAQAAPSTACFAPNPGVCGGATGSGSVSAPAAQLCASGTASSVASSGGLWRWSCQGVYSQPTGCTAPQWVCQPNQASSCSVTNGTGTQMCNGSGTGFGTCTATHCNAGHYLSGNACVAQACSPNTTRTCSVTNGSGTQTCDNLGSAWGGCLVSTCNGGYVRDGNTCVPAAPTDTNTSGTLLIPSSAYVDPAPPAGWTQCVGFVNTAGNDVAHNFLNGCLGSSRLRIRVSQTNGILEEDVEAVGMTSWSAWPNWNYLGPFTAGVTWHRRTYWGQSTFFTTTDGRDACGQIASPYGGITFGTGYGGVGIIAGGNLGADEYRISCGGQSLVNRRIAIFR